jgi:SAM-dependent methyltransferase
MASGGSGVVPFFDQYDRFLESSKTGRDLDRLNARYTGLVHRHREQLRGATVLDLASHDGRFSFAALDAGAARVLGVEIDGDLVVKARDNLAAYGVEPSRFEFVQRDLFRAFDDLDQFDVVFCVGILYHLTDHMQLLTRIALTDPALVLLDTKISQLDGALVELRSPLGGSPPVGIDTVEGYPTRSALDVMVASLGWKASYLDWHAEGLDGAEMDDYVEGRRVTLIAEPPPRVDQEMKDFAVGLVHAFTADRSWEWRTITGVAEACDVNPYALRTWVQQAAGRPPTG